VSEERVPAEEEVNHVSSWGQNKPKWNQQNRFTESTGIEDINPISIQDLREI
jgi:hypothetical protein